MRVVSGRHRERLQGSHPVTMPTATPLRCNSDSRSSLPAASAMHARQTWSTWSIVARTCVGKCRAGKGGQLRVRSSWECSWILPRSRCCTVRGQVRLVRTLLRSLCGDVYVRVDVAGPNVRGRVVSAAHQR